MIDMYIIYIYFIYNIVCKYTSLWFCEQIVMWSPKVADFVAHNGQMSILSGYFSSPGKDPFSKGSEDNRVSGIDIVYIGRELDFASWWISKTLHGTCS